MENPQAFPVAYTMHNEREGYSETVHIEGMTLRDYFAGKALHMLIFGDAEARLSYKDERDETRKMTNAEYTAMNAYLIADAMLKERAK